MAPSYSFSMLRAFGFGKGQCPVCVLGLEWGQEGLKILGVSWGTVGCELSYRGIVLVPSNSGASTFCDTAKRLGRGTSWQRCPRAL